MVFDVHLSAQADYQFDRKENRNSIVHVAYNVSCYFRKYPSNILTMIVKTKFIKPEDSLSDFVESFWMLHNESNSDKKLIILPDGRIDLFLSHSADKPFHITLLGLESKPSPTVVAPNTLTFAISFNLLATEYIFHNTISDLLDNAKNMPDDFWNFNHHDLTDFELFCEKATRIIIQRKKEIVDVRKKRLFDLIYSSKGSITVKELSEKSFWSSRQINRYFNQQFGISLKSYCNILRFRASFENIKAGKLFPEADFADQSHFIKEIKRLSGVSPRDLKNNHNDRFIQLSSLPDK